MKKAAICLIRAYQICVRPYLGSCCRFTPSCSDYAKEAFEKESFFRACALTLKRLVKCGPWHPGGHDPLKKTKRT